MAGFIGTMLKTVGRSATMPARSTIGSTLMGAAGGGMYNYATSPYDSSQLTLESMLRGAVVGGVGGFGVSAMYKAGKFGTQYIAKNPGASAKFVGRSASRMATGAGRVINFAARHPALTAGGIGAAYMAGGIADMVNDKMYGQSVLENNPYQDLTDARMGTNLRQEEGAANLLQQGGVAPMGGMVPARRMLMESTNGLVQGLHRSRHR